MIDIIKNALKEAEIKTWRINEKKEHTAEVFFIRRRQDMRRIRDTHKYNVEVFCDYEKDGKPMRGRSQVTIVPSQSEQEVLTLLKEAKHAASFAGNPYFIDLDQLAADGLLKPEDYAKENWGTNPNYCDYALLYQKRYKVLRKAYAAFLQQRPVPGYDTPYSDDWYRFTFLSDAWLPDYCLYMAIKEENKMCDWQTWPAPLRLRDPKALEEFRTGHADPAGRTGSLPCGAYARQPGARRVARCPCDLLHDVGA